MDPLKPFGSLSRAIWARAKQRTSSTSESNAANSASLASDIALPNVIAAHPVQSRLRALKLDAQDWDPQKARDVFVEAVLLSELGENIARDPNFYDVVKKVSLQLGSDKTISERLDNLLRESLRDR